MSSSEENARSENQPPETGGGKNPELDQIALLLRNLGANDQAAFVMARQLLKRADQLAEKRGVGRVEAIDYLLKVTIAGTEGRVYEGDPLGNGTTMRDQEEKKG